MRELRYTDKARRQLENLEKNDLKLAKRLVRVIRRLGEYPLQGDTRKLTNSSNYRARMGKYRIVYSFNPEVVEILNIMHRKDVYRK